MVKRAFQFGFQRNLGSESCGVEDRHRLGPSRGMPGMFAEVCDSDQSAILKIDYVLDPSDEHRLKNFEDLVRFLSS